MKTPRRLAPPCTAAALALMASTAHAGPPFAWNSTVDSRLVFCPAGDIAFHATVRRTVPIPGVAFIVEFCSASGWAFEVADQPASIGFAASPCMPRVFTDAGGVATLALRAGGATADSTVALYADGVPFGHRYLSSPDQNGDLLVSAADEAILVAKLGSHDISADFDGDGTVTEADRSILRAHLGHANLLPTATVTSTWGRTKALQR